MSRKGGWIPNPGKLPKAAAGKRVRVILERGKATMTEAESDDNPTGWAADGKGACRWSITGHPFDIAFYKVIA